MNRSLCVVSVLAAVVLAVPGPVRAADDGVFLIDAACVASGCFPSDFPGFPVTISQRGSYRLTSDLDVPDEKTTAIRIFVPEVTLDLGGFTIRGVTKCQGTTSPPQLVTCSPVGPGIGIDSKGITSSEGRIVVRDGTVSGMGDQGIRIGGESELHDLRVVENGRDGIEIAGALALLRSLVVTENGGQGILVQSIGGQLATLSDSVVSRNGGDGLKCLRCVVTASAFTLNRGDGIDVAGGTIRGCSSDRNDGFGLRSISGAAYAENYFLFNNGGGTSPQVFGGVEVGLNNCNGSTSCP